MFCGIGIILCGKNTKAIVLDPQFIKSQSFLKVIFDPKQLCRSQYEKRNSIVGYVKASDVRMDVFS